MNAPDQTLHDAILRLEAAGIDYMLTGSVALNYYTHPRATLDVDLVVALYLRDAINIVEIFGPGFYVSPEAAKEAVLHQSCFNAIHQDTFLKVDLMIRKREEYRLLEFERRRRISYKGFEVWIVSKEDLILSKLDWGKESISQKQIADAQNLIVSGCDMEYLHLWSARLNLTDMLTRATP